MSHIILQFNRELFGWIWLFHVMREVTLLILLTNILHEFMFSCLYCMVKLLNILEINWIKFINSNLPATIETNLCCITPFGSSIKQMNPLEPSTHFHLFQTCYFVFTVNLTDIWMWWCMWWKKQIAYECIKYYRRWRHLYTLQLWEFLIYRL